MSRKVIHKIVLVNIMEDVEKPKAATPKEVKIDEDETGKILKALEDTRIYAGVFLITRTGMHVGEVLGLRWKDIDFDENTITIKRNLQRNKSEGLETVTPKTEKSFRTIYVDDEVLDVLQKEQERQQADEDLQNSKLVVCNNKGTALEPRRFVKEFNDIRNKVGLNDMTRHSLRHAVASILIDNNVPVPRPRGVSALFGHADQSFTFRRYVHSRKDATKKAAAAITAD